MYIIANWKMNLDLQQARELTEQLRDMVIKSVIREDIKLIICPSFGAIDTIHSVIKDAKNFHVGAQDVFWKEKGAFTGEMSASMLKMLGCEYVIIGHSERRRYMQEDDEMINLKIQAAVSAGLTPILCVGETFDERSAGHTDHVVMRQVIEGLKGIQLSKTSKIIVAYEPVWVIGTGQSVEPEKVDSAVHVIDQGLIDLYPLEVVKEQTRIIYGGSVDHQNVTDYLSLALIRGALIGTASLSLDKFMGILRQI